MNLFGRRKKAAVSDTPQGNWSLLERMNLDTFYFIDPWNQQGTLDTLDFCGETIIYARQEITPDSVETLHAAFEALLSALSSSKEASLSLGTFAAAVKWYPLRSDTQQMEATVRYIAETMYHVFNWHFGFNAEVKAKYLDPSRDYALKKELEARNHWYS